MYRVARPNEPHTLWLWSTDTLGSWEVKNVFEYHSQYCFLARKCLSLYTYVMKNVTGTGGKHMLNRSWSSQSNHKVIVWLASRSSCYHHGRQWWWLDLSSWPHLPANNGGIHVILPWCSGVRARPGVYPPAIAGNQTNWREEVSLPEGVQGSGPKHWQWRTTCSWAIWHPLLH